jgi:hypothetical protein
MSDSLEDSLREALGDADIGRVELTSAERRQLEVVASRTQLNARLVEDARTGRQALDRMKSLVVLEANMGFGPEEISAMTGRELKPEGVVEILREWHEGVERVRRFCPASADDIEAVIEAFLSRSKDKGGPLLRWLADRPGREGHIRDAAKFLYKVKVPTAPVIATARKLVRRVSGTLHRRESPIRLHWDPDEGTLRLLPRDGAGAGT